LLEHFATSCFFYTIRKINQSNSAEECLQWCKLAWDELLRNASV